MGIYKISGTKSETARIMVLKESDWSIEYNTVVSGSGAYEVDDLDAGTKIVMAETTEGEVIAFGDVDAMPPYVGDRAIIVSGHDSTKDIEYITITSLGNGATFGDMTAATLRAQAPGVTSNGNNNRGITCGGWGGSSYGSIQAIDYVTITTTAQAQLFGNLTSGQENMDAESNKSNNRAFVVGRSGAPQNNIEYITLSSLSDAAYFGDATVDRYRVTCISNAANNRGLVAGGTGGYDNYIEYITISSTGNASAFGDLFAKRSHFGGCSNGVSNRGIFAGAGDGATRTNIIEYINIASLGDGVEFGDLIIELYVNPGCDNATSNRGIFPGGGSATVRDNTIQYITISTTGNATYFGDLTTPRSEHGATANAG